MADSEVIELSQVERRLGGRDVLGHPLRDALGMHDLVRQGFPVKALRAISRRYPLSEGDLALVLRLSPRTLRRRFRRERLSTGESECLLRLVLVLIVGEKVLGDEAKSLSWLLTPIRALDGRRPLELLTTQPGYEQARDILRRIEYGVWS